MNNFYLNYNIISCGKLNMYLKKYYLVILIFQFIFICCNINYALSTDFYIDQGTGNDTNSGTSITNPWKTISKANSILKSGDTVYIRQGTYYESIKPINSGSSGSEIKYSSYNNEVVTISNSYSGIELGSHNYINVYGIKVTNVTIGLWINGGDYNTISYCTFGNHTGNNWDGNLIYNGAQYNWIHHCTFHTNGECTLEGSDDGSVIRVGSEGEIVHTSYNLIEDSIFYYGGHHVFGLHGDNNVIRNNYMHNEAWSRGRGNRTLYLLGKNGYTGHNIIEGNRFGYAAAPCDAPTVGNVAISTPYNIFRYNYMYHQNAYGLGFGYYSGYDAGAYNRIYNNVIHNTGYNIDPAYERSAEDTAVNFFFTQTTGNILKNNLYSLNYQIYKGYTGNQSYANEFIDSINGNPLFTNATATPPVDKIDSSVPDFTLFSTSSPAIDAGGPLTVVNSLDTGTGISLIVNDSRYFQDGSKARAGLVQPDWLAVGSVDNVVKIASINYSTNTITIASSIIRNDNDPVWLYKKSDGKRVLFDAAPDAGASEFSSTVSKPSVPANFLLFQVVE